MCGAGGGGYCFCVGESLRIRENSLESGSGLVVISIAGDGGDCLEVAWGLRGGDGGLCADTTGRSGRSFTLTWLRTKVTMLRGWRGGRGETGRETYFACFLLRAIIFSAISVGIGAASFSLWGFVEVLEGETCCIEPSRYKTRDGMSCG